MNTYRFPASVRHRLAHRHPQLSSDQLDLVEAGLRQWFRLAARRPGAKLMMPSRAVDDLWHELLLHTRDYAEFCQAAFGRFLHHQPDSAVSPIDTAAKRARRILLTLRLARQDEHLDAPTLPLLFRIDTELDMPGGRRYLSDCGGGQGQCYGVPEATCLRHPDGASRRRSFRDPRDRRSANTARGRRPQSDDDWSVDSGYNGDGGCSGGCS